MTGRARVLHVARREWAEAARQPWMLGAIGALYGLVAASVGFAVGALGWVDSHGGAGILAVGSPKELAGSALTLFAFLAFTQVLGIAAVASGHALLHDRQCGTFTFLLLAPITRVELLVGKVLGAIGWPVALYLVVDGLAAVGLGLAPIVRRSPELAALSPASPAFVVAFIAGAPAWAAFLGAVGAVLSSVARDVRSAQQGVWFAVFFTSLAAGGLLTGGLAVGPVAELAIAGLGLASAGAVVAVGAGLLARDVGR